MKRNTALVKKLRQVGEDSRQGLLEDIAKTNQSKVCPCGVIGFRSESLLCQCQACGANWILTNCMGHTVSWNDLLDLSTFLISALLIIRH